MAIVTGLTAAKMQEFADASVVSGAVDVDGHLQLTTQGGDLVDAGDVIGPKGDKGDTGADGATGGAPSGAMMMYGASIAPTGWLLCDGSPVSRTTYSDLFAVVGTSFGVGNGSTTFNLPNMNSRMPRQDTSHFAQAGGTTPASHSHSVEGGIRPVIAHVGISQSDSGPNIWTERIAGDTWTANFEVNDTSATTSNTVKTNGAKVVGDTDLSDDLLPPYLNVSFIIKY